MIGVAAPGRETVAAVFGERRAPARVVDAARRVLFVDASRGLAVVGMLVANLVNVFLRDIPGPLAHNQGDVLRAFDFPAPVFQLLVGLSLPLFLAHRRRRGRSDRGAALDAVRRFVLLILLGMVLDGIGRLSVAPQWGVLQTLGLGGLVATALGATPASVRVLVMVVLLGVFSGTANGVVHENPAAALAFVPLTIAGTFLGDAIAGGEGADAVARLALRIAALAGAMSVGLAATGIPFNKVVGTSSFVTLATALGAGIVGVSAWWESRGGTFPRWLLLVGKNALTAWVLLHVLVYYPAWLVWPAWDRLALAPGLVSAAGVTALLCASTVALGRRGVRVTL